MNYENHQETANDTRYSPKISCRWSSYSLYRLLVLVFLISAPHVISDMSHGSYFGLAMVHFLVTIFIGIPIIYSEICIAQYTNCSLISLWNYFPLFRGVGHAMIFTIFLRTLLLNVLNSWYLIYTFYGALNPPPWFTCEFLNVTNCMVKRVNVAIFQHCLEAQRLFHEDCDIMTASSVFFAFEIGVNNTQDNISTCFYPWKPLLATLCVNLSIFLLSIKGQKYLEISVKLVTAFILLTTLLLSYVALSANGTWSGMNDMSPWHNFSMYSLFVTMANSFLTLGTGTGLVVFLSRDAGFRRPATMTAVGTPLLACTVCVVLGLVIFCGLKNMSFFHGSEDFVVEVGDSLVFEELASIAEILSYFDSQPFWGFLWFSIALSGLYINIWISYEFIHDLLHENTKIGKRYKKTFQFITKFAVVTFTLPFYCCDLYESLYNAVQIMQLVTTFLFSVSLYWFYGFNRHADDIIFMIGVKANIYWKTAWAVSPVFIAIFIIGKWQTLFAQDERAPSRHIGSFDIEIRLLFMIILGATYLIILIGGTIFELVSYDFSGYRSLIIPTQNWGPKDNTLYKSRRMFIPQVMTTEFLYRQVRIRGYKKKTKSKEITPPKSTCILNETHTEWSVLTSN